MLPQIARSTVACFEHSRRTLRGRRGFSLLEFLVAMLLFGITVSGLFPLVTMYSRMIGSLEQRPTQTSHQLETSRAYRLLKSPGAVSGAEVEWYQVPTGSGPNAEEWVRKWYLTPFSDSDTNAATDAQLGLANGWARRFGATASVRFKRPADRPGSPVALGEPATLNVSIDAGATTGYSESLTSPTLGGWSDTAVAGAVNSNEHHAEPAKVCTATWTFTGLDAGWYRIGVSGLVSGGGGVLPTNTYQISHGVILNEDITPGATCTFATSDTYLPLATRYIAAGETLTVQLTTDTTGTAIADSVQVERCSLQTSAWPTITDTTATVSVDIKTAVRAP